MDTAKRTGRTIAVLLLAQIVGSVIVNSVLLGPVFAAPGFLVNAATHPMHVALAVLLGLATSALGLGIAIAAWPVVRPHSRAMAQWLLALAVAAFAVSATEYVATWSLLNLSQAYAKAGVADAGLYQALRGVVASARNGAHYVGLVIVGFMLLVFYGSLYRFRLVPRALATFGLAAVLLQMISVAMPLYGEPVVFAMLMPLGLCQLALALWLLARGLAERAPLAPAGGG
ncbi:MAG TPA: DUF4386 family protein [Pseudomonadota bacterium]|nr:DUF4386 family protein [Pseudomonadota bacterium]